MSDDLAKRLRDSTKWYHGDCELKMAAADCIREQRDLLDECERALTAVRADLVYAYAEVDENLSVIDQTLAKLRGQEKADD